MKRASKSILPILLLLTTAQLLAQDGDKEKKERKRYEHFKERNISKTYTASGNSLNVENRFGNVKITTWDKNEIKVDIHLETSSTDKEFTEKSFERMDVEESKEGNNINLKTILNKGGEKNTGCNNCSNTIVVDYDIRIPANNTLKIQNSFGDINIPDYTGPVTLTVKYGGLTAGKLSRPEKIVVEFGKADLKSIGNIDLEFKYSKVNIGNLTGNCKLKFSFCGYSKINLDNGLTSLTVNDSYSSVHLVPPAKLAASYTITTSYGSFVDKTDIGINRADTPSKYGADLTRRFEGKSGAGTVKVDIKSSFGKIMIGEGTEKDMKEKKKVRT
ncbi:MAG TPA: hypothetical protein VFU29_15720 [Chitinophagaceae bacterium]|nr:hypothetical protein [Chitinophagaceae bacterium]